MTETNIQQIGLTISTDSGITLIKPFCWLSINCLRYLSLFISFMLFLIFANIGTFW